MKYARKSSKNSDLPYVQQHRCYGSIDDLPILIWFRIIKTGDLGLLIKPEFSKHAKAIGKKCDLQQLWDRIYDQYMTEIGIDNDFRLLIESRRALVELRLECILNPSPINQASLLIAEEALKEKETQKELDYHKVLAIVGHRQGYSVFYVSVREFYSYTMIHERDKVNT
jgi:hypothetical protein